MSRLITTKIGLKKLCKAHAGAITLPPITKMAWGKGGVGEDGEPKEVTGGETGLADQLLEKDIEGYEFIGDDETACRYYATIEEAELAGESISEVGLLDSEGDLVRYKTMPAFKKPDDVALQYDLTEVFEESDASGEL